MKDEHSQCAEVGGDRGGAKLKAQSSKLKGRPKKQEPNGRQGLDCGEGVCEVTALAVAALEWPRLAAGQAASTESGDSADSVAAVQDAARADLSCTRFIVLMRSRKTGEIPHDHSLAPSSAADRQRSAAATQVAQSCTLPYRRFAIGWRSGETKRLTCSSDPQNAILRYSRLKICATRNRRGTRRFGQMALRRAQRAAVKSSAFFAPLRLRLRACSLRSDRCRELGFCNLKFPLSFKLCALNFFQNIAPRNSSSPIFHHPFLTHNRI